MTFKSSTLRIATAIALTFVATSAFAGDLVVTQIGRDTFHYTVATPVDGQADADRARVLRDAQKLASAMGARGYQVVRESSQTVGGSVVRHVDIKLNGVASR